MFLNLFLVSLMYAYRDVWIEDAAASQRGYCPPERMDSESPLFILYTSGSTGKPKGLVHTTAGYLLYATLTHKYVFDVHPDDVYACVADCGWITGHSYVLYGPLANGATTLMFESTPLYPDAGRYWDVVQRHKITQFYTVRCGVV
jgi:acetyl-CoA synthetase